MHSRIFMFFRSKSQGNTSPNSASSNTASADSKKRFFRKRRLIKWGIYLSLLLLVCSTSPLVAPTTNLSPSQAAQARRGAAQILKPLMSSREQVSIRISNSDLEAISDTVSYTVPAFYLRLNSSAYAVSTAVSLTIIPGLVYVNAHCLLMPNQQDELAFSECKLGSLPVPGLMVEYFFKGLARVFFGKEALVTLNNILKSATLSDEQVAVQFEKPSNLKDTVEGRLSDTFKVIQDLRQIAPIDGANTQAINFYIAEIRQSAVNASTTAEVVGDVFAIAQQRSFTNDPVEENQAALWALAITLGAPDMARIVALPVDYSLALPSRFNLRNRLDLRLHFFISVGLRLASEKRLSINIGKLKEILDSAKGGSGYSFVDLTADKAGVELADFTLASEKNALRVQDILAKSADEGLFIPLLHDLPEGLNEAQFARIFGSEDDPRFREVESTIDERIAALPLYSNGFKTRQPSVVKRARLDSLDTASEPERDEIRLTDSLWLQIDTHIHTRFSDGQHSIQDIAARASSFGCDAIAITDHGDGNLKGVFSNAYWDDFYKAKAVSENLLIMPGLEWNVPPFRGREHLTLLLPENAAIANNLQTFRDEFDHYGSTSSATVESSFAFEWLNNQYVSSFIKPVIFYNHPSRKDLSRGENKHDLLQWINQSPFVVGFSGAPGHQKKRGDNNGSYTMRFRTIHGWDPSVARTGADWDQVLQSGTQAYAARAASDFHNTDMDYWPCQFSTTHVNVERKSTNAILSSLANGSFWAQHGKFVNRLSSTIENSKQQRVALMGQIRRSPRLPLNARLSIELNDKDWQGFTTSIDEVTAVLITERGVETKTFYPSEGQKAVDYRVELPNDSDFIAVRWFGHSVQPEKHYYQFFTNPTFIVWRD